MPNVHWYFHNAVLTKSNEFWSNIEEAMDELADYKGPDQPFDEFLDNYIHRHNLTDARSMATLYVEGFHAAHADRISVKGLIKTNRAAAQIHDETQFRPSNGYQRSFWKTCWPTSTRTTGPTIRFHWVRTVTYLSVDSTRRLSCLSQSRIQSTSRARRPTLWDTTAPCTVRFSPDCVPPK